MATFRPFGYQGKPQTCIWCGRRLRYERVSAKPEDKGNPTYKEGGFHGWATIQASKPGPYYDGMFCTMSCGYLFGRRQAQLGRRLSFGT